VRFGRVVKHAPLRLALLCLLLDTRAAGSQESASTAGTQRAVLSSAIDSAVQRVMAERGTPGAAVAFLQDDSVLHLRGYGVADRERGSLVTPGTVFQIASLTKPLTAAAVLLLVDDKRLSLDDRAERFLEWLPERYRSITVRQLLTHTSGVAPDMRRANVDEMSEAEFRRRFVERPASFAPGHGFQYANAGYTLLSQIVERVSGHSFEDFLRARVFVPLRMRHSGYRQGARSDGRQATGYDLVDGVPQRAPHVFSGWGNSGIETTVEDLAQWAQSLQRRTLLSVTSDRAMFTPGRLAADTALNFPFRGARAAYGLGWFLTTDRGDSLFTHGGAIAGFSSVMHRLPGRGWTLIVLSNLKQGADRQGEAEAIANAIIASLRAVQATRNGIRDTGARP
jgi:CubicO group peptidase (beta-lactamase class C family)